METTVRGHAVLCTLACFVLVLCGCKSEAPPSGSTDRVEHAPSDQSPTNTDTITGGAVFVQSVTFDGGTGDGGPNCTGAGDPTMGVDAGASCTGALGQATFQWAVCACNAIQLTGKLTTDGFNSALGPPDGGIGGNVGANGNVSWSSAGSIGGNLWTPDNVSESAASVVRGDLHVGGTVTANAALTVDGNAFAVKALPKNVTVLGTVSRPTSVAAPCDCSSPVPIGSIVAAHSGSNNDNASIGLSSTAAASGNPGHITLPCGNYYLTAISPSAPLTIEATGHTALYVGGNIAASAALVFQVDTGATLDLFVEGNVTGSGPLTLGSTAAPAHCRAFVAGSSLALSATSNVGCNVYAPNAALDTSGALTVYGSLFASSVAASGNATVHFDTSILNAGGECCSASTCDDGNPCTVDSCNGDGTCSHTAAVNGTSCTGTNLCEQKYTCQSGACTGSNPVTCAASDQCHTVGTCTPSTGQCSNPEATNGTSCNDGNACTQTDACESGTCTGSNPVTCTASDSCHVVGTCNSSTGTCSNPTAANGTSCNDGNACTQTDACENGTCTGSNPVVCTASDQCHAAGVCSPATGACSNPAAANGTACNDGNACTQTDACQAGACVGANPVTCTASDQCHGVGTCSASTGTCSSPALANGTSCNDGNACTQSDTCQSGTCTGGNPVACTASDQCHAAGTCNTSTGTCSNPTAANGTACSDGNACTQTDSCQNGACTGSNPVTCTASDQCHTSGTCDTSSGTCSNPIAANGTSCSDGNACTQTDSCQNGACAGSNPVTCGASDQCHTAGTCDAGTGACSNPVASNGTTCNDGNACTQADSCQGGLCTGSNPVTCTASDQCHAAGACDPTSGSCSNPAAPDGASCNDGNACTQGDVCSGGSCAGTTVACTASDACHVAGTCDAATGQCSNPPASDGTACTGTNKCDTYACASGSCAGTPVTCPPPDPCHSAGTCDPNAGQCTNPAIPNCDATPTLGDEPFETNASIMGRVQTLAGGPVAGYTVTIFDVPVGTTPRSDAMVTIASDGSFYAKLTAFPTSEPARTPPHHLMAFINAPGFLLAKREVYAHPGFAVDLGVIDLAARDPNTVTIGAGGGSVTDSQGLITLQIPAGALSAPTPITVTPILNRDEMPAHLSDATLTAYGFEIEPTGTQLAEPATVHVQNWRDLPTTAQIPAGFFDDVNGGWQHEGMASWDGSSWTYSASHFSTHDINPNNAGEWLVVATNAPDPNTGATICGGSAIAIGGGSLTQDIALPTYRHRGHDYGVTLNYNSGLAASRTLGGGQPTTSQAAPHSGITVSIRSSSVKRMCVPQDQSAALAASSPGSCAGGSCSLAAVGGWAFTTNTFLNQNQTTIPIPSNANGMDFGSWVELPLLPDGTVPGSGYVSQLLQGGPVQTQGSGASSCGASGAFGSPNLGSSLQAMNTTSGPVVDIQRQVFVHHRHNSPFGPGWALADIPRAYPEPQADHIVLVGGDGSEEDFRPRALFHPSASFDTNGPHSYIFATDPQTAQVYVVDGNGSGNLSSLSANGTATTVSSGLGLTGQPQSMAITYVGGEQRFLVALTTQLVQIHAGGAMDVLYTRSGNDPETFLPSQVAGRNDLAIYTEGKATAEVVYRIRLSTPPGSPETISAAQIQGSDVGLDPGVGLLGEYAFYAPAGLAYGASGELYIADSPRNAVFLAEPDVNGEIGPTSAIRRVLGDGVGRYVPDVATPFNGLTFPINQPYFLSMAPDGTLFAGTAYGIAEYDPISTEAEWLAMGQSTPTSDLTFDFASPTAQGTYTNFAGVGPRSFWACNSNDFTTPMLVDVSQLTSERDPTRTIATGPTGSTLTDTARGLVESYDAQGRLIERGLRTGEPVMAVTYADATTDRVSAISDPEGNATAFSYDGNGRLATIQDPAGHVTQLGHDGSGDLRTITQPDGELIAFSYQAHRLTTKTARGTDTTTYAYNTDGTLQTSTKPAGEITTLTSASLSQAPTYNSQGSPVYSGSYTDAHGVSHAFVTDSAGQLQSDTYTADGVQYTYGVAYYGNLDATPSDPFGRQNVILRISDVSLNSVPTGLSTSFDALGRVSAQTDGGPHSASPAYAFAYDANGFVSSWRGPSNPTHTITRDGVGHPISIIDTDTNFSREMDLTWRTDGQPATMTQHGVTYTLSYDEAATHDLTGIADSLGRTNTFGLDAAGNLGTVSDGVATSSFAYDGNNRLLVAADALGNQTVFGYTQVSCGCTEQDKVATIRTPDLPSGKQWALGYGAEGRLTMVTDPDGFVESYGYEPTGELNSLIDRDGNPTTLTHDHLGRVASIIDALDRTHASAYTVPVATPNTGQPGIWQGPSLTSGSASATAASTDFTAALNAGDYQVGHNLYLTRGYPAQISFYRDATFELAYEQQSDLAARPTVNRDRAGVPISSTELTNFSSNFFEEDLGYDVENDAPLVSSINGLAGFDYNSEFDLTDDTGFGRGLCSPVPVTGYTYTRDVGGRLTGVNHQYEYGSNCGGPATVPVDQTYAYYPNGRLQKYTGADGTKMYTYDTRGLVQSIALTLGSQNEQWTFDYDTMGRSVHVTYPDGHVREQLYDDEGRIKSRCYNYGSQSHCYTATYDAAGNPLTMTDPYAGSDSYAYDALNRLTQVTRQVSGSTEHVETYGYNAIGAVKTTFDPIAMAPVTIDDQRPKVSGSGTAAAAVPNSIGGQPVTLDAGGRVTGLNGATFTYDLGSLLKSAQATVGSNTISDSFGYDAFQRRVEHTHTETSPAQSTQEFAMYDGANLVATLDQTGALKDAYLFDGVDHPLRLSRAGASYFYEVDLAGNVRRLRDSTGADLGGYRYTAFGAIFAGDAQTPAATLDQPLQWKGRPFQNVAGGIYDMRARWWSPQMGAFLSVDEYAYHRSNSTLWGWTAQNPIKYNDPSGRDALAGALGLVFGGVVGGVSAYLGGGNTDEIIGGALAGAIGGGLAGLIDPGAIVGAAIGAGTGALGTGLSGGGLGSAVVGGLGGALTGALGSLVPGVGGVIVGSTLGLPIGIAATAVGDNIDNEAAPAPCPQ